MPQITLSTVFEHCAHCAGELPLGLYITTIFLARCSSASNLGVAASVAVAGFVVTVQHFWFGNELMEPPMPACWNTHASTQGLYFACFQRKPFLSMPTSDSNGLTWINFYVLNAVSPSAPFVLLWPRHGTPVHCSCMCPYLFQMFCLASSHYLHSSGMYCLYRECIRLVCIVYTYLCAAAPLVSA